MSPAKIFSCRICNSSRAPIRRSTYLHQFTLLECTNCGTAQLDPTPSEDAIANLYNESYYGNTEHKFFYLIERFVRWSAKKVVRKIAGNLHKGGRVLDIGCGRGVFFPALLEKGFEVHGVEVEKRFTQRKDSEPTIYISNSLIKLQLPSKSFDLIILWHVLEHLADPKATLAEIYRLLSSCGQVAIAVPNYHSLQANLFGRHWFHLDLPRHLFQFDEAGLRTLLQSTGFTFSFIRHFSLLQTLFGWIQSLLNCLPLLPRDCLYQFFHSHSKPWLYKVMHPANIISLALGAAVLPIALIFSIIEFITGRSGTIEIIGEKRALTV